MADGPVGQIHDDSESRKGAPIYGLREDGQSVSDDARQRWSFLAEASELLASTLDYESTLRTVAGLSVPLLESWSIVDLLNDDGSIRRLAIVHPDPDKQQIANELEAAWPPSREDPLGVPAVVRTGTSELISHVSDQLLVEVARGAENLGMLRELGIASIMTVPMRARGRIVGAMTFCSAFPNREFRDSDASLAEDLARRCAVAIDNARLHQNALRLAESEAARRQAEVSDRTKSEFLTLLSHELRTPLNGIAGYLELLAMEMAGPLTQRQRDYVDRVQAGERQLLRMVEDMLNFIRLYSGGEVSYDLDDVHLVTLVEDVATAYRPVLEAKDIELIVHCPVDLRAHVDSAKVWQILFNLLSNARKFTEPAGKVTLECTGDETKVLVTVEDTGCGIPPDKLEAIFEPFRQVDSGLNRRVEGLGLGLTVGRQLARGMGGDLTGSSADGGCTFTLSLPAAARKETFIFAESSTAGGSAEGGDRRKETEARP
jgi:signal transduction histidine kinase